MKDWMTLAIAFLGAVALGLMAFLFYQPGTSSKQETSTPAPASASNQEDVETGTVSSADTLQREGRSEKWSGEVETKKKPRLLFYAIPD